MSRVLCAWSLVAAAAISSPVTAQVTFLGPTPYLSAADSPFDMSGLGSTFFFEDFEDGVWDLPSGAYPSISTIQNPGALTDSVDGDDGLIDGNGNEGHSLMPLLFSYNPTNPITWHTELIINFDESELGGLPRAFGFVWTDGLPHSRVSIVILDENLSTIGGMTYDGLMGNTFAGETSEDRFIGLISDRGIRQVGISNSYRGNRMDVFEVDHIQFGLQVPEPNVFLVGAAYLIGTLLVTRSALSAFGGALSTNP